MPRSVDGHLRQIGNPRSDAVGSYRHRGRGAREEASTTHTSSHASRGASRNGRPLLLVACPRLWLATPCVPGEAHRRAVVASRLAVLDVDGPRLDVERSDNADGRSVRAVRLIEKGARRDSKSVLIAEERVGVRSPESGRFPLAVRRRLVVPDTTADSKLVATLLRASRHDARAMPAFHAVFSGVTHVQQTTRRSACSISGRSGSGVGVSSESSSASATNSAIFSGSVKPSSLMISRNRRR